MRILCRLQSTCCSKCKSLWAKVWEGKPTFLHSNAPRTRRARKSVLPRPNTLPTQYIFRTEPYICLQSTVHQAEFYFRFLLPPRKHWLKGCLNAGSGVLTVVQLMLIPHLLVTKGLIWQQLITFNDYIAQVPQHNLYYEQIPIRLLFAFDIGQSATNY